MSGRPAAPIDIHSYLSYELNIRYDFSSECEMIAGRSSRSMSKMVTIKRTDHGSIAPGFVLDTWGFCGVGGNSKLTCYFLNRIIFWLSRLRLCSTSDNALIRAESAAMILDWRAEIMSLLPPISLFHDSCLRRIVSQEIISFPLRRNSWWAWVAPTRAR